MDIVGTDTASKTVGELLRRSQLTLQIRSNATAIARSCTWWSSVARSTGGVCIVSCSSASGHAKSDQAARKLIGADGPEPWWHHLQKCVISAHASDSVDLDL